MTRVVRIRDRLTCQSCHRRFKQIADRGKTARFCGNCGSIRQRKAKVQSKKRQTHLRNLRRNQLEAVVERVVRKVIAEMMGQGLGNGHDTSVAKTT